MAGIFSVMNGHVYEGRYAAAEELANGMFVKIDGGKVKKLTAADATMKLKVVDNKAELFGDPAVEVVVMNPGTADTYMVESLHQKSEGAAYDDRDAVVKAGELVRMRRPEMGDHMTINVSAQLLATLNNEDAVNPTTGGLLVKSSS